MRKFTVPLLIGLLFVIIIGGSWAGILGDYIQLVLLYIGLNIILTVSLNLVNGYMGEFSCGHAGFMAVGAYVTSVLTVRLFTEYKNWGPPLLPAGWSIVIFPLALIAGAIGAAIAGLLVAIPSFRTRGDYLAIITLAVNYIVKSAIENMEVIGGPRGFLGMQRVMNAITAVLDIPWLLIWTFIGAIGTIILIQRFVSSTFGKGVMAIREDEVAAGLMGVNTRRVKLIAFMVSCGLAGVAGGLFAHGPGGYINPGMFTILKSTEAMVMVYLGGMGSTSGNILSAVFFTLLLEMLRPLGVYKWVVIPLLLVVMMLFRPTGLMGNRELVDVFPQLRVWFGKEEEYAPASN
mgnify:CR=1 FL=1